MSDSSMSGASTPLGVGQILSESFSILARNFVKVITLSFSAAFLGFLINGALVGFDQATGLAEPFQNNVNGFAVALTVIIPTVMYGLVTALLVQLAYDAKLDRQRPLSAYFGPALKATLPIAVLSFFLGILSGLGAILLIVGALWVYAVFSVMAPAAVIERAGFGAMGRSAELTKNYRWPIAGLLFLLVIILLVLNIGAVFLVITAFAFAVDSTGMLLLAGVILSLVASIGYGLGGIVMALIYARLREIKEGVGVDQIAKIFE